MTTFMYLYRGGTYPESPEEVEKVMAAWQAWMTGCGDNLKDGGNPLGEKAQLGGGEDTGVNGYSLVEADSMDAAKALADGHPHIAEGGTIEIATITEM